MNGGPLPLDQPGWCPCCHARMVRSRIGSLLLFGCDGGCPGVRIARKLGLPLGDESPEPEPQRLRFPVGVVPADGGGMAPAAAPLARAATRRGGDDGGGPYGRSPSRPRAA